MAESFRRIVTGFNSKGKSVIVKDTRMPSGLFGGAEFWRTHCSPAALGANADADQGPARLEPPPGGTLFRFFEIPPQDKAASSEAIEKRAAELFASVGASHCRVDTRRHWLMHTTKTIDYVLLLRGEITLLMDEGEVDLQPFDAVIQRGTNHSWINRGKEPALLMAVLVDAGAGVPPSGGEPG